MNVLNVGAVVVCVAFLVLYFIWTFRPLNIKALLSEIGGENFTKVERTWRSRFLTLQPTSILQGRMYRVWYFKTEFFEGCQRESLIISRLLFAPLHVFYDDGKVIKVKGGAVKFEILEDEDKAKTNLEKLLKVIQRKHREVSTNPLLN